MAAGEAKLTAQSRIAHRTLPIAFAAAAFVAPAAMQSTPGRIISLVPNVTEMLFAIGAGPRVVAVGTFDHFPPEVAALPRVGALLDPNVEKILSLKPDLAIVYESQIDLRQQLDRAHVPMFVYKHGGLADIATTLRALGERTGNRTGAERAAADLEGRIERVRTRVAGRSRPRTLLVFGRETEALRNVNVSGSYGFLHDMLGVAGGANLVEAAKQSVQVSVESMLALAPEVIIELRYTGELSDAAVARAVNDWRVLASVPAVRNGRVYVLVGDEFVVPGPRLGGAIEKFARVLHPEAFKTPVAFPSSVAQGFSPAPPTAASK